MAAKNPLTVISEYLAANLAEPYTDDKEIADAWNEINIVLDEASIPMIVLANQIRINPYVEITGEMQNKILRCEENLRKLYDA